MNQLNLQLGRAIPINGTRKEIRMIFLDLCTSLYQNGIKRILFIDTINFLDPHRMDLGDLNEINFYDNIFCVRTGLPYDLYARLSTAESFIRYHRIQVLLVSSISSLFSGFEKNETKQIVKNILEKINNLTEKCNLFTIIGNTTSDEKDVMEAYDVVDRIMSNQS
ncbi:MAG: hypothetical protein ABII01_04090 [Candidatus Woesearchaeota archaeon]